MSCATTKTRSSRVSPQTSAGRTAPRRPTTNRCRCTTPFSTSPSATCTRTHRACDRGAQYGDASWTLRRPQRGRRHRLRDPGEPVRLDGLLRLRPLPLHPVARLRIWLTCCILDRMKRRGTIFATTGSQRRARLIHFRIKPPSLPQANREHRDIAVRCPAVAPPGHPAPPADLREHQHGPAVYRRGQRDARVLHCQRQSRSSR